MNKARWFFVVLMACFIIPLSACNNVEQNKTGETDLEQDIDESIYEEEEVIPTFGGTLKIASRNPETLNPLFNKERSVDQVLKLVFDSLFVLDENYKPVPSLVDRYELSEDNTSLIVTLKEGILFHDGEMMTASDVAYSIEVLKNAEDDVIYKSCVENIQRTSIIDELNLKIYFKQPYAFALYDLVFPILPEHYYSLEEANAFNPVGSGPYQFESYTSMQKINLTANQNFRESVFVENIECTITRDLEAEKTAFEQNLIDLIFPSKFDWLNYSEDDTKRLMEYTTNYYEFIGFNHSDEVLKDVNIRKAIGYSIDRDRIAKNQFLNHVVAADSPINPDSWLKEDDTLNYTYNPEQSKTLLEENGWEDIDEDGFYDLNAEMPIKELSLLVNKDNISRMKTAELIRDSIQAIGIKVVVQAVDNTTFMKNLQNGNFDLVLTGWKLSSVPDFTSLFHSKQIGTGSNFIRYSSPEMDLALEKIYTSANDEQLKSSIQEFDSLFVDELPYYSLYFMNTAVISNHFVYGELTPQTDFAFDGIENLYISR